MDRSFRFASALSTQANLVEALEECLSTLPEQLGGPADLVVTFFSHHHVAAAETIAATLCDRLGTDCLLGGTGEAIVGGASEIEEGPALVVWAARMPGASLIPFHLTFERAEGGSFIGWPDELLDAWPAEATMLVLGEPFTFPADALLERLGEDRPDLPVLGGMVSGGQAPGENRLLLGRKVIEAGAVCLMLSGTVRVRSVVSQGCRPIGRPLVVTKSQQNIVTELGGQPALAQLREIFGTLPEADQRLVQRGLHFGLAINAYQDHFSRGDFLVRNVIGFDPDSEAIGVGDFVRVGQTAQFHVRDAASADEDLRVLLTAAKTTATPGGALLFTCNGRGTRLFAEPHHDALAIREILGDLPLAGFFAQGEIGPIGGRNFLHGFTASLALFEPRA